LSVDLLFLLTYFLLPVSTGAPQRRKDSQRREKDQIWLNKHQI